MKKLYVFDMDGTLLINSTANIELAKELHKLDELEELEIKFSKKLINTKEFAHYIHKLWGIIDAALIKKAFINTKKLKNIRKVISDIKKNNHVSCIITMSPNYFANLFYDYGFDFIFASNFPKVQNENLDLEKILTPEDKPKIVKSLCLDMDINMKDNVIAFGDSMSDYPLFKLINQTIAINGDEKITNYACCQYKGDDLMEAYNIVNNIFI